MATKSDFLRKTLIFYIFHSSSLELYFIYIVFMCIILKYVWLIKSCFYTFYHCILIKKKNYVAITKQN